MLRMLFYYNKYFFYFLCFVLCALCKNSFFMFTLITIQKRYMHNGCISAAQEIQVQEVGLLFLKHLAERKITHNQELITVLTSFLFKYPKYESLTIGDLFLTINSTRFPSNIIFESFTKELGGCYSLTLDSIQNVKLNSLLEMNTAIQLLKQQEMITKINLYPQNRASLSFFYSGQMNSDCNLNFKFKDGIPYDFKHTSFQPQTLKLRTRIFELPDQNILTTGQTERNILYTMASNYKQHMITERNPQIKQDYYNLATYTMKKNVPFKEHLINVQNKHFAISAKEDILLSPGGCIVFKSTHGQLNHVNINKSTQTIAFSKHEDKLKVLAKVYPELTTQEHNMLSFNKSYLPGLNEITNYI